MIEIELRSAIMLYAGVIGVVALAIWLYTELTVYRPQRYLGQQFLWKCTICGYSFLNEKDETLTQCPRCESYIDARDKNARAVPVRAAAQQPVQQSADEDPARNPSRRKRPHQKRRGPRRRR